MKASCFTERMTESAIAELYRTFQRYPRKTIEACPCCVGLADAKVPPVRPLPRLSAEDLYGFQWSAIWTMGDTEDLKHFLPRILELALAAVSDDPGIEMTLGLLRRGAWDPLPDSPPSPRPPAEDWSTWPAAERDAVTRFLTVLWESAFSDFQSVSRPSDVLTGLARALPNDRFGEATVITWLATPAIGDYLLDASEDPLVEAAVTILPF